MFYLNQYQEKKIFEELTETTSSAASKEMMDFKIGGGNKKNKRRLCRMGQNFGRILANGDVYRCCTFEKSAYLGNMIAGTFKLLEEPAYCTIEPCTCYRAMMVGEEDRFSTQWCHPKHKDGVYYEPTRTQDVH